MAYDFTSSWLQTIWARRLYGLAVVSLRVEKSHVEDTKFVAENRKNA
jgi:hypothetical protein